MKRLEITINGVAYPCSLTMGAMLRFKELTGHEVTDFDGSMKDMCAFIWSCIVSSCRREGKKFDMDFMEFADCVDPKELADTMNAVQEQTAANMADADTDTEKKTL